VHSDSKAVGDYVTAIADCRNIETEQVMKTEEAAWPTWLEVSCVAGTDVDLQSCSILRHTFPISIHEASNMQQNHRAQGLFRLFKDPKAEVDKGLAQ